MPVLLAAMSLLRVESGNGLFDECGNDGVPDCWPVVESQIDEVFGLKRKSAQRIRFPVSCDSQTDGVYH